jgi:Zn-dependent protease with chaperone function
MRRLAFVIPLIALAACVEIVPQPVPPPLPADATPLAEPGPTLDASSAARNFVSVVNRMEPMIEEECRQRARGVSCDFRIIVDDRAGQPPNAYQTLDKAGRPIIAFTLPLIGEARNTDELSFIMGHEAAHHIRGHLARQQQSAMAGALIIGGIAAATGGDADAIKAAQDVGFNVGARTYSKDFELEADELGTIIAWNAGYDPERGAQFFARISDPGNRFLGTHPPNGQRIGVVRATVAALQSGRLR